jgi:hypothetical protein
MVPRHLWLCPQSHSLRVKSVLPLSRLGDRLKSRYLLAPGAEVCWWVFKRVALFLPDFVVPLQSSGGILPWFTTIRLFEQPCWPMPHRNSLDQEDICGRGVIHLHIVYVVPSLKSGSIGFWCTFTRFSVRPLNGTRHALYKYFLLNSFAVSFLCKECRRLLGPKERASATSLRTCISLARMWREMKIACR